ncbi:MAG: twin-arginine translocase subunit TatC [Solirubrobacteraceae bacterium]
MPKKIRMIGHEDQLSLVDHLEELRSRIIVCLLAFSVAFAVCFWQNHTLLKVINAPLAQQTKKQVGEGKGPLGGTWLAQHAATRLGHTEEGIIALLAGPQSNLSPTLKAELEAKKRQIKADIAKLPRKPEGANPTTIGFGEPFTQTLSVAFYAAVLISLPILLYELYGFLLPAFRPEERRVAMPLLLAVPFLFALGVAFGYFVVLPAATHFFQNFNSGQFNVLVQATSYYKFASLVLIAMGLVFQVPVAVLAVTEAEILTPAQLRKGRRYALVACAAVAAFIPGEVITMALETIPLYLLYELSVWIAAIVARRRRRRVSAGGGAPGAGGDGGDGGGGAVVFDDFPRPPDGDGGELVAVGAESAEGQQADIDPEVRELLDHIDPDLHG